MVKDLFLKLFVKNQKDKFTDDILAKMMNDLTGGKRTGIPYTDMDVKLARVRLNKDRLRRFIDYGSATYRGKRKKRVSRT